MSRLLRSSGAAGAATALSRVLGFIRMSAFASFMGDGAVASAWAMAEQVPNLFRRLLGEGALTAAFVPTFRSHLAKEGEPAAWRAAAAVMWAVLVVSLILVGVVTIGVSLVLHFGQWPERHELTLRLLRVMFPYVLLVCTAAVFIGLLNARGRFFLPALGATMLNVVMIGSVYLLAPRFGATTETQVFGLAAGYLLAGLAQALFQIPALLAEGFRFKWVNPLTDPTVREVLRKMGPATLGVAAYQVNVLSSSLFASSSSEYAVASFTYATRLMELPQGIVGISIATVMLTDLSGLAVEKKFPEFRRTLRDGLLHMVFVNALAAVLLLVLAHPMIRLLFERGEFTKGATLRAAGALALLAPGLLFFSTNNILARAFYAINDTKTPMWISLYALAINLVLVFFLVLPLRQSGLALANTLSGIANTALLFYALKKALPKFSLRELLPTLVPVAALTVAAGLVAWQANVWLEYFLGYATIPARVAGVFGPIFLASVTYLGLGWWIRLAQAQAIIETTLGRWFRRRASTQ